ncbi:E3 ubiquitin-protein ligase SSM4 [Gigaspora margarita]|uniref:E3 ubiquitin-protein ligase SSM4 n=1 Tax=Gigaspora margarita TaxID=4874 RepID=A0A8H3WVF6_GIGMA|nr:E3 ubiquitin-protein ligase SSM4 [Gigaspora margarita]
MDANLERQTIVNIPSESKLTPTYNSSAQIHMQQPPPKYITTQPQPVQYPNFSPTTHNVQISLTVDEPVVRICKICQESEFVEDEEGPFMKGKLISPCKCKGSIQYVHIGCLNQWRTSSVRKDSSFQCEVCKYEYKFYRPNIAKIISNPIFLHFTTFITFFMVVYVVSWIVKLIDAKGNLTHNDKLWINTPILGLKLIYIICGLCIISFLSSCFFCFCGRAAREDLCYCGACTCCVPFDFGGPSCIPSDCGGSSCMPSDCGGPSCESGSCSDECNLIICGTSMLGLAIMIIVGSIGALLAGYFIVKKYVNIYLNGIEDKILEVEKE